MKLFRLSSLLCGAMLLLSTACTPPYIEEEPIGLDTHPRRFFFNTILAPQAVYMAQVPTVRMHYPAEHGDLIRQGKVIEVFLTGRQHVDPESWGVSSRNTAEVIELSSNFESVATAQGDGNYYAPKAYSTDGGAYKHTLSSGIRSMSLTALGTYNATYPEGSDLSPITQVYWMQVERKAGRTVRQEEMQRIWQVYGRHIQPPFDDFLRIARTAPLSELKDVALPALGPSSEPRPEQAQLYNKAGVLCYIVLKEQPDQGEQALRLTLTLMDGRELTRDVRLQLGN